MSAGEGRRPVVLVADDNEHNREYARQVLADRWEVLLAQDGVEALALARALPALVLLDISMPGLDGTEVALRLKADPLTAAIPVVACTAHAMRGDKEWALSSGFDAYLPKPYRPAELVACVEDLLGPSEAREDDAWTLDLEG